MEQNVQAYIRRTLSIWNDHQTCSEKCEIAKTLSFQGHGVETEFRLRTFRRDNISKPERWTPRQWLTTISVSKKYTNTTKKQSTQRGCAVRKKDGPLRLVVDMSKSLLKADFNGTRLVTRDIRSQVGKSEKHTFEFNNHSIFLIKGPRNSKN